MDAKKTILPSYRFFAVLPRMSAIIAIGVGVSAMVGWLFNIDLLKSVFPGLMAMKFNTAGCLILTGVVLLRIEGFSPRLAVLFSAVVAIIGFLTLLEYGFRWNLGIDQWLVRETVDASQTAFPGRMSSINAVNFCLIGGSLMLSAGPRRFALAQLFALGATITALLSLVGLAYGVQTLYPISDLSPINLSTAMSFVILGIGIFFEYPASGLAAVIVTDRAGGLLARRLLPAAIIIPLVIGWLRVQGQQSGLINIQFGQAVATLSNVGVFSLLVLWMARLLNRIDGQRSKVTEALHQANEQLEAQVKERTAQLVSERNLLRTVIDSIPSYIYVKDTQSRFVIANSAAFTASGLTSYEQVAGITDFDLFPHDMAQAFFEDEQRVIASGQGILNKEEVSIDLVNKQQLWFSTSKMPLRDEQGTITGVLGISWDITDRKRAESRFRALLEFAPDAMIIVNQQGNIVLVNSQTEAFFGYTREELVGKPIEGLIPQDLHTRHVTHRDGFMADPHMRSMGVGLELNALRKDGSQFPVEISLSPIETAEGMLIVSAVRDITERKRAENALRDNEQKLKTFFEVLPVGISVINDAGQVIEMNPALERILGLSKEGIARGAYRSRRYIHNDGTPLASGDFPSVRAVTEQKPIHDLEFGVVKEDGTTVWTSVSAAPLPLGQKGAIVVTVDITERKQIEAALRESEGRFRQIMEHLDQAFWLREAGSFELIYMSPAYETITGRSVQSFLADSGSFLEAVHPEDRAHVIETRANDKNAEYRIVRPDGSIRWVLARVFHIDDNGAHLHRVAGITEDITERKLAEQRALELGIEKERVTLLSNFVRNISHEFRTPLAAINSTSYILSRAESAEERALLNSRINLQVNRLVHILEEMLVMAELDMQSVEAFKMGVVTVNQLINDVLVNVARLTDRKQLHITKNLDLSLPVVPGDRETLSQAISNVVQNAVHYTAEGGSITVQTRRTDSSLLIEVADTGVGIDAEDLPHIFERLYRADTARTLEDTGTGLGLSIANRIMELHCGKIEVESVPRQGSVFRLILPLTRNDSVL